MSSAMMLLPIIMLGGMGVLCSMVLAFIMFYNNGNLLSTATDAPSTTDPASSGENCYHVAQSNCQGKTGKERGSCISSEKNKCMKTEGNYWDTSQTAKDDLSAKKNTIIQAWNDQEVDVLPQAYNDINENCVYFYDSDPWNQSAPKYRGHGWACLGDGQKKLPAVEGQQFYHVGDIKNKKGSFTESHEKYGEDRGAGPISNHVDYMRVGKNIDVTVYDGWRFDKQDDGTYKGTWNNSQEYKFLGSNYGTGKLISLGDQAWGFNKLSGFNIEKAS